MARPRKDQIEVVEPISIGEGAAEPYLYSEIRVCHDHAVGRVCFPSGGFGPAEADGKVDRPLTLLDVSASTDAASPPISVPAPNSFRFQ